MLAVLTLDALARRDELVGALVVFEPEPELPRRFVSERAYRGEDGGARA